MFHFMIKSDIIYYRENRWILSKKEELWEDHTIYLEIIKVKEEFYLYFQQKHLYIL